MTSGLAISYNIEVIVQICFGQTNFCARQEHSPECAWVLQHEHGVAWSLVRPRRAVPESNAKFLKRAIRENFAQDMTRSLPECFLRGDRMHRISDCTTYDGARRQ